MADVEMMDASNEVREEETQCRSVLMAASCAFDYGLLGVVGVSKRGIQQRLGEVPPILLGPFALALCLNVPFHTLPR